LSIEANLPHFQFGNRLVSYLVRQRQGEEVQPVGIPLGYDLGQGLVVSHLSGHFCLVVKVHRNGGTHRNRAVYHVPSRGLGRIITLLVTMLFNFLYLSLTLRTIKSGMIETRDFPKVHLVSKFIILA